MVLNALDHDQTSQESSAEHDAACCGHARGAVALAAARAGGSRGAALLEATSSRRGGGGLGSSSLVGGGRSRSVGDGVASSSAGGNGRARGSGNVGVGAVVSAVVVARAETGRNSARDDGEAIVRALVHVETNSLEGAKHGLVVGDNNVLREASNVVVDVSVGTLDLGVGRRIVASNRDVLKSNVKVTGVGDIGGVPVDLTTSPVDGTLGVGSQSTGPDGDLDEGGSLGVVVGLGGSVEGILLVEDTADLAVDGPGDGVLSPVNLVGVEVLVGVREGNVSGLCVVQGLLPVVVGLGGFEERTNKLVINFITDARHEDERRDDTLGSRGLEGSRDFSVPDGSGGGQDGTSGLVGHGKEEVTIVVENVVVGNKVVGVGITEVLCVLSDSVSSGKGVVTVLADGGRSTGGEVVGVLGITGAQAVGTGTALTVEGAAGSVLRTELTSTTSDGSRSGGGHGGDGSKREPHY